MHKLLSVAFSVVLLGTAASATAQNTTVELTPEHFAELDKNKSGGVSKQEYEQFMRDAFKKLDTDGSNSLSPAETSKVMTPEQFAAVDKDNNGEISLDELIEQVMRDFDRHDSNKDGILQP
ncbi:EF-hand domain-containing protein [Alcaligenaceae bacterium]|nr:EF-hand domain-containing protein [Alcaligenaceae bacterium]